MIREEGVVVLEQGLQMSALFEFRLFLRFYPGMIVLLGGFCRVDFANLVSWLPADRLSVTFFRLQKRSTLLGTRALIYIQVAYFTR